MKIKNPHDASFQDIFSDIEKAEELIKISLPVEIIKNLNWKKLRYEKNTFVDENLKNYQSDMIFSIKTKNNQSMKRYVLFEHKSYRDKNIHIQLLSYLSRIYSKMEKITPVIPILFYHGKDEWNISEQFYETFNFDDNMK
jgi:predicted transposase/invertase (TIGR01784 family)